VTGPARATMPAMVLEIADLTVVPERADAFADAVRQGIAFVAATPGFRTARLTRGVETPNRFVLLIEWDSVEAHNVGFRESENFGKWRGVIGEFLAGPPHVEHVTEVDLGR
jgi:heme-degrading monooxygenase HmoA